MSVALVTGAGGFLGRALVPALVSAGWEVLAVARRPAHGARGVRRLSVDLARAAPDHQAELLVHLACPSREQMASDPDAVHTLAAIDANVIEAARRASQVVLISSAAVYGDRIADGSRASSALPLAPSSRYGRAKVEQEERWRAAIPGARLLVVRLFNATGPGEPPTLVGRATADRLCAAEPAATFAVRSSESVRDFLDVRDAAAAVAALVAEGGAGTVDACSGAATSVRTLVERLVAVSGRPVRIVPDGRGAESRSVGDPSELHRRLAWRPRWDLEASMRAVWAEAALAAGRREA